MKAIYIIFALLLIPTTALARIGVGVGTGKIYVDQPVYEGTISELPSVTVLNTGDEPSYYSISVEVREYQDELKPDEEWFKFTPNKFYLEPGAGQIVRVDINVPLQAEPGDYFAFLSAHPDYSENDGELEAGASRIGIAAAAKLYFTIPPANIFEAIYYRTVSFVKNYSPWTYIVGSVIIVAALGVFIRKNFSFNIAVKKK